VGGNKLEEKIFRGPLDQQLRDALTYLRNSVIEERVTRIPRQAEAERIFNYPHEAPEESLVNAVYHRSYEHRSWCQSRSNRDFQLSGFRPIDHQPPSQYVLGLFPAANTALSSAMTHVLP
jgi:hypothetical protein